MEKDTREAIRSVVGSLPEIDQLKPEQERALQSFVGGRDVVALLPTGFGKSLIFQLAPLAVKEPVPSHDIRHDQTLCDGYGRSRVALGRSNHFKTSTYTRLQVSERLSIEQFQTFCTNEMKYDGLVGPG